MIIHSVATLTFTKIIYLRFSCLWSIEIGYTPKCLCFRYKYEFEYTLHSRYRYVFKFLLTFIHDTCALEWNGPAHSSLRWCQCATCRGRYASHSNITKLSRCIPYWCITDYIILHSLPLDFILSTMYSLHPVSRSLNPCLTTCLTVWLPYCLLYWLPCSLSHSLTVSLHHSASAL